MRINISISCPNDVVNDIIKNLKNFLKKCEFK